MLTEGAERHCVHYGCYEVKELHLDHRYIYENARYSDK